MAGPKRDFFLGENFSWSNHQKVKKKCLPNLKYQLKNKYPSLAKNFTKGYHSVVTHVLSHFCDISLITACAIFCSLNFHVVCTCTFFGDGICLPTNRKMIKIENDQDLHIVLTYDCWHSFLVLNIWVSRVLEITTNFYYPTLEPFTHSKFCLPNPFLFRATPHHK